MYEQLIDRGTVRKQWINEAPLCREHLTGPGAENRRNRFGGALSHDFIRSYAEPFRLTGAVIHGFFIDVLRGSAEQAAAGRARRLTHNND